MNIIECGDRVLIQTGKDRWQGWRRFLTYEAGVAAYSHWLWNQVYPGMSGDSAPRVIKTRGTNNAGGVPGLSFIEAFYETKRQVGKARFIIKPTGESKKIVRDLDGKIIKGPDDSFDKSRQNVWQIYSGDNTVPSARSTVILQTAYPATGFQIGRFDRIIGKRNSGSFYGLGAGTLLYLGPSIDWKYGDENVEVDHVFWRDPQKWEDLKSILAAVVARKVPVLDADDYEVGYRTVLERVPGMKWTQVGGSWKLESCEAEERNVGDKASFAVLEGLNLW